MVVMQKGLASTSFVFIPPFHLFPSFYLSTTFFLFLPDLLFCSSIPIFSLWVRHAISFLCLTTATPSISSAPFLPPLEQYGICNLLPFSHHLVCSISAIYEQFGGKVNLAWFFPPPPIPRFSLYYFHLHIVSPALFQPPSCPHSPSNTHTHCKNSPCTPYPIDYPDILSM